MFRHFESSQIIAFCVLAITSLATGIGVFQIISGAVSLFDIVLLLTFHLVTVMGVECGFHRYASHNAFVCKPFFRNGLLIAGSMAFQGPLLFWVAVHRQHHAYEDSPNDPHTPRPTKAGVGPSIRAFLRSHFGWLFEGQTVDYGRYCGALVKQKALWNIHERYALWCVLSLLVPTIIGMLFYGIVQGELFTGAVQGLLWGGLIRIFCVHHLTWSVNSFGHIFGKRPFKTKGHSGNISGLSLFTLGGALHNNHHAFPTTAHNALLKGQIDICGSLLGWCEALGWVWSRNIPNAEAISRKLKQ